MARLLTSAVGCALALALVGSVVAGETDEAASAALIERIAAAHRAITSVQGHAVWRTRHGDDPTAPATVQEVQFTLLLPDKYQLVFSSAGDSDTRLVVRSDGVTREELQYQFKDEPPDRKRTPVGKDDQEFARLLSCFRLDMPVLSRDFTVQAASTADGARLAFAPARPDIAEHIVSLVIQVDALFRITQLVWSDPQGNRYEVTIDQSAYDQPIDPATFQVTAAGAARNPGK